MDEDRRVISRQTSDLDALRELLDSGISSLALGLIFMALTAVSIFSLDWITGFLVLASAVPMYFLSRWYQKRSQGAYRSSRVVSARLIVHFIETMTGIRAVKASLREEDIAATYDELAEDYCRATVRSINLNGIFQPGLVLIGNVAVTVVLLVGGFRVLRGALEVGALLALLLTTKRFFAPVSQMAMVYNSFQSAQAALEKVSGLLEEVPTVRHPRNPIPLPVAHGGIRFTGAEFSYGSGRAGSLTLDGVELRELSTADLRRAVVMLTQEGFLFSGTVAENIALGNPAASRAEIETAAGEVGADAFIRSLPDGYDTDVNKRGGRVSAGQRQLISFARAFLADPAVLILDEATS